VSSLWITQERSTRRPRAGKRPRTRRGEASPTANFGDAPGARSLAKAEAVTADGRSTGCVNGSAGARGAFVGQLFALAGLRDARSAAGRAKSTGTPRRGLRRPRATVQEDSVAALRGRRAGAVQEPGDGGGIGDDLGGPALRHHPRAEVVCRRGPVTWFDRETRRRRPDVGPDRPLQACRADLSRRRPPQRRTHRRRDMGPRAPWLLRPWVQAHRLRLGAHRSADAGRSTRKWLPQASGSRT